MRDTELRGEKMEPERAHFIQVPHASIGYHTDTSKRAVDVRVDLAPEGTARRLIQLLRDDDARRGNHPDVVPVWFARPHLLVRLRLS